MDAQRKIIESFKRDLPAILSGDESEGPSGMDVRCNRCGMHFRTDRPRKDAEISACYCGRRMAALNARPDDHVKVHYIKVWAL